MFVTPPTFRDNVDQILSAGDLNILRDDISLLDNLSFRTQPMFDSSSSANYGTLGTYKATNPFRVWKGYFKMRAGATTLTIKGRSTATSISLKVYVEGVVRATISSPQDPFTQDIDISGLGFTDGQVVLVEITTYGAGNASAASIAIHDIYISPLNLASWPGVPTFTSATLNAANLNLLGSACTWLYNRLALVPMPGSRCPTFASARAHVSSDPIWVGAVQRGYTEDIAALVAGIWNISSTTTYVKVYLDGVLAYDGGPYGPGWIAPAFGGYIPLSLSGVSVGDYAELSVHYQITDAGPAANWKNARAFMFGMTTAPQSGGYGISALPAAFAYGMLNTATLVSNLNSLATIAGSIKTRIDAAPHIFARARAARYAYCYQDTDWMAGKLAPLRFSRRGSQLVVRGKDVKLCSGAWTVPVGEAGAKYEEYEFPQSTGIVSGDKIDTKTIYLDTITGVSPGAAYYLLGDVYYAEELL